MGWLIVQFICLGLAGTYEIKIADEQKDKPFFKQWWRTIVCTILLIVQMGAYFVEKAANAS